jgi:CBS domain-containing protein
VLDGRRLTGIITADDLTLLAAEPSLVPLTNAVDLMRPPVSVRPQDNLQAALEAMVANGIREIPVTDDAGNLVGWLEDRAIASAYLKQRSKSAEPAVVSANSAPA